MEIDWKKKYEEALNKARELHGTVAAGRDFLTEIFPELCESEDEKIREEIVSFIRAFWVDHRYSVPQTSKWLDWLEKKKDSPMPEDTVVFQKGVAEGRRLEREEQKPTPDWMPKFLDELRSKKHYFDWDEHRDIEGHILAIIKWIAPDYFHRKEKEQKPVEKQDYSGLNDLERAILRGFLAAGMENVPIGIIKETAQECLAQMKPAEWSEEDSRKIGTLSSIIADYAFHKDALDANNDLTGEYAELDNWLGTLPERFNLQPKQEWNEDWREEDIQTRFAFYTYKDDPSTLYLSNVFVEEASRNYRFGTRILRAAEKVAETIGATTISLKVKQDSPANAWYRKNGFGYVTFEDGYDWLEKNLEYMKPTKSAEWSEEDEEIFNLTITHLLNYAYPNNPIYCEEAEKCVAWLKSLKNRGNFPQSNTNSPNEWNVDDESAFGDLMWCIEQARKSATVDNMGNVWYAEKWLKNRLKSLRPSWKPSKEQMGVFGRIVNDLKIKMVGVTIKEHHTLESLYNDIKKLM